MKKLMKRFREQEGFTLSELLIVVGIIAVLSIISIPIFSTKLELAREETDIANIRAAKAAAVAMYMENKDPDGNVFDEQGKLLYYDAVSGLIVKTKPTVGYGQGTEVCGGCADTALTIDPEGANEQDYYVEDNDVSGMVLACYINSSGMISVYWVNAED